MYCAYEAKDYPDDEFVERGGVYIHVGHAPPHLTNGRSFVLADGVTLEDMALDDLKVLVRQPDMNRPAAFEE